MALEGALTGLYVGADHAIDMTVYTDSTQETVQEITGWAILLDIRDYDRASTTLLSVAGTVSGVFNSSPGTNTQNVTFALSDTDLAASIFKGDDTPLRYSIKRTDNGFEQPLRYGDVTITRVTQV
jgi:hypothetical protein